MEVFRLSQEKYANILSGKGAALRGARWNSVGSELIYTASNRSLAMADVAVHLTIATLPVDFVMMTLEIPDTIELSKIDVFNLPLNWNAFPHPSTTQQIGDSFIIENKYCVLHVPSSVTKGDYNLLINPKHPDFKHISIINTEPFPFDRRMFK